MTVNKPEEEGEKKKRKNQLGTFTVAHRSIQVPMTDLLTDYPPGLSSDIFLGRDTDLQDTDGTISADDVRAPNITRANKRVRSHTFGSLDHVCVCRGMQKLQRT